LIEDFIEAYFIFHKKNKKRGYQIIDNWIIVSFFSIIIMLISALIYYSKTGKIYLIVIILILSFIIIYFNKTIDKILSESFKEGQKKDKDYIILYFENQKFNHSVQFNLLSKSLKDIGNQSIKKYEFTPLIAIVISIVLVLFNNTLQSNPSPGLYGLLIITSVVLLSFNPIMNVFANLFYNVKPMKIVELSKLIEEICIERSIQENSKDQKTKIIM
jgi:hypothetical protein